MAIKSGANPNIGYRGTNALILFAKDYPDRVEELLDLTENDINIDAQAYADDTALMLASEHNHEDVVSLLIEAGAETDLQNTDGQTALMMAVMHQSESEVVSLLIEAGADLNIQDSGGRTVLMIAAEYGKDLAVLPFILAGADTKIEDRNGRNAYDIANMWRPELVPEMKLAEIYVQLQKAQGSQLRRELLNLITRYVA